MIKYCHNCGQEIPDKEMRYCISCGEDLRRVADESATSKKTESDDMSQPPADLEQSSMTGSNGKTNGIPVTDGKKNDKLSIRKKSLLIVASIAFLVSLSVGLYMFTRSSDESEVVRAEENREVSDETENGATETASTQSTSNTQTGNVDIFKDGEIGVYGEGLDELIRANLDIPVLLPTSIPIMPDGTHVGHTKIVTKPDEDSYYGLYSGPLNLSPDYMLIFTALMKPQLDELEAATGGTVGSVIAGNQLITISGVKAPDWKEYCEQYQTRYGQGTETSNSDCRTNRVIDNLDSITHISEWCAKDACYRITVQMSSAYNDSTLDEDSASLFGFTDIEQNLKQLK